MTHYVLPYTPIYLGQQRAVCGRYVDPEDVASAPTCLDCQVWIAGDPLTQQELDPTVTAEDVFGAPGESGR